MADHTHTDRDTSASVHAFELADVGFSYGPNSVLRSLSLQIPAASFIGVVGANGSGKTTLLRLLSGYLQPGSGSVRLFENDVRALRRIDMARTVAFVPQTESVIFPYPVRSFVMFGRHPHTSGPGFDSGEDSAIVSDALNLVGIAHLSDRLVTELSGGEMHRASIARALAQATPVILLDEPNAHLDISHQFALFDLLAYLSCECRRTVVCVTHDLNLASAYCDHIAVLHDGRLLAYDSPARVLKEDVIRTGFGIEADVEHTGGSVRVHGRRGMTVMPEVLSPVFRPAACQD